MIDRRIGKIKVRRGTDSQRKLVSFEEGELVYSTDKKRLYIGNGNNKGGIIVSNRNYVKNSLGVPPVVPSEVLHGDIVYDKSNYKTYITKWNGASYELILIADGGCGAPLQIQINDLNNRITTMAGCLASKPPPVIPPVTTKLSWYDEPIGVSINLGDTITLASSAYGGIGPVIYNWRRTDNITVASNTDRNLIINNAQSTDIATYYCVANNNTESITSRNAEISLKPPTIKLTWSTEPSDVTVNLGETVVFYSNATGLGTITYSWKRRDKASINTIDANSANLTINNSVNSDIATYYCVASNSTESITSKDAVLNLLANSILAEDGTYILSELNEFIDWQESGLKAPTITTQPRSQVTTSLVPVTFEVTATGSEPLSYQWRINGVNVAGETKRTYTVTNPTKDLTGITCVVSNIVDKVISNSVNLTVGIKPSIVTQPISQSKPIGSTVTFSVVADGSNPLAYQWSKDGSAITGATSNTYTISYVSFSNFGEYSCTVSNTYGIATSNNASLQLGEIKIKSLEAGVNFIIGSAFGSIYFPGTSFFISDEGVVYACGYNSNGELGDGSNDSKYKPTKISLPPISKISSNQNHTLFLATDGTVYSCGYNSKGQLGDGTTTSSNVPIKLNLSDVSSIAVGAEYSFFVKTDGDVYVCGSDQLGNAGNKAPSVIPVTTTPTNLTSILNTKFSIKLPPISEVFSDSGIYLLATNGDVYYFGYTPFIDYYTPLPAKFDLPPVSMIANGSHHVLFLGKTGTVSAYGENDYGQLGDGTTINKKSLVELKLPPIASIAAGLRHSLFLGVDGTVFACGSDFDGALGNGVVRNCGFFYDGTTCPSVSNPTLIKIDIPSISKMSASYNHSLFLGTDGSAYGCGRNLYGALGDGSSTASSVPIKIKF